MLGFSRFAGPAIRQFSTTNPAAAGAIAVSEVHKNVFHVKLNRPEKRNTFTYELWQEMKTVFDGLAENPKCRSIVISGEGKSFCAGIDLKAGMGEIIKIIQDDLDVGRKGRGIRRIITVCQDGFTAIQKCPKPVIAAVHSHCIGAGVDLITACDIRYASSDAIFNIKEVDIGMAADVGTLNRIEKVVGNSSWVREIAFTSRDVPAHEALKHGLVSKVFDSQSELLEASLEVARKIAGKSPIGVQGTKEVLNHARDHTTDESLNFVKTWNMSQILSTDLVEGAMASMSKQKAEFKDV
ncbi:unnamed protein product [Caenorhabditis auriculariae]|uniref:Delta(3,5)-Delta(2,4)-dienoyl-CoA isomerase, mitochondrial n=1 Tax=Caenorhabditis auriculariae TaxID=2777116 RepID=A0A8S1HN37_9PELO|nr:unnamed protein product [Caenorhabditis auriculariae]